MHSVEVRPAVSAEASAISRLLATAIRDSYTGLLGSTDVERLVSRHCPLTRINAEIGIRGGAPGWLGWLVAVDADGTVLGTAAGGVPLAGHGELYALCMLPSRRHEGIGSTLLAAATDRMRAHQAERQSISLPTTKDPALPFYERHGFTGDGTRLARTLRPPRTP
ncbi:GNAT family N-acetyltransferase [Streptomyces sp. A5-4]|uniref:GNAT family N-acetyltransferase n=1 Tax=Streptomyces sp. A5-4 TaxID=3384771 RepID=UPI003DA84F79